MRPLTILILLLLLMSCQESGREVPELIGTWETTWVLIMSDTDESEDGTFDLFYADSTNWEEKTSIKPIRTQYFPDGTFRGEYRNLQDSVYAYSFGTWEVRGDSLYFRQVQPDTFIATYWFQVKDDTLRTRSILDWDRDGMRNDKFEGTQKLLKDYSLTPAE